MQGGVRQLVQDQIFLGSRDGLSSPRSARHARLPIRLLLRVSVNTLQGTTSFWEEVRAGIADEARSLVMENVEIEYRTCPHLGEGEEEAFEAALKSKVDGIITFPSRPQKLRSGIRRASRSSIPVVCVATDAPGTGRLAVVPLIRWPAALSPRI